VTTTASDALRPTLGGPYTNTLELYTDTDPDFSRPGEDAVCWDLGEWSNIVITADLGDLHDINGGLYVHVNTRGGTETRAVTPDQVRAYAAQLLALADRHDAQPA